MGNFWLGAIVGWVAGELGLVMVIALVSDREDRRQRREITRDVDRRDDDERDSA